MVVSSKGEMMRGNRTLRAFRGERGLLEKKIAVSRAVGGKKVFLRGAGDFTRKRVHSLATI